jgi:uncharacterized protein YndB with AHSA1/START domain
MAHESEARASESDREIVITRVFDAPRHLAWRAFTDPRHIVMWWGPKGFTTTILEMDVRPNGVWRHVMHGPDGTDYPNNSVFKEVVRPERIVYSIGGGRAGDAPVSGEATWTFDEVAPGKTRVTIRMVFPKPEDFARVVRDHGAVEGGRQTLERLDGHMAKMAAGD